MSAGLVFDIRKFSVHDGPGIRTAVFLKGCPLDCPWCHNPEGRDFRPAILRRLERCILCHACDRACPLGLDPREEAGSTACGVCPDFGACARACPAEALQLAGRRMDVAEVMEELRKDRPFYEESEGGVTFTGGEPLGQPGFLLELLDACRAEGLHTAIETSGYARPELLLEVAHRADLLLFDLKFGGAARGSEVLGVDYRVCLENFRAAAAARAAALGGGPASAALVARLPFIPGFNDSASELGAIVDFIKGAGPGVEGLDLLPYHDSAKGKYRLWNLDYRLADLEVPSEAAVEAALDLLGSAGIAARRGG